jgi:hypothetical protein
MLAIVLGYLLLLLGSLLSGCNAEPQVMPLSIEIPEDVPQTLRKEVSSRSPGIIGIGEFSDSRRERALLGMKAGRWGFLDSCIFTVRGDIGQATAGALAHYLRRADRQTTMVRNGQPDIPVHITGDIIEMRVNAVSGLLSTHLSAHVILILVEENEITGKISSVKITGSNSRNIVWFDPQDAESVLADSLADAFQRWLSGGEIETNASREQFVY